LIPAMVGRPEAFCAVYTLGPGRATVFALMPDAEAVPDRESGDGRAEFAFCPPDYLSPSRQRPSPSPNAKAEIGPRAGTMTGTKASSGIEIWGERRRRRSNVPPAGIVAASTAPKISPLVPGSPGSRG